MLSELMPGLYLGDIRAAERRAYAAYVNVTHDLPDPPRKCAGLRVNLLDPAYSSDQAALVHKLPAAVAFIDVHVRRGQPIIIYCGDGEQRSAAVAAAYLIWRGWHLSNALSLIRRRHRKAFRYGHWYQFEPALRQWSLGPRADIKPELPDEELCICCLAMPRSRVYAPCSHCVCCEGCADLLSTTSQVCPWCSAPVEKYPPVLG